MSAVLDYQLIDKQQMAGRSQPNRAKQPTVILLNGFRMDMSNWQPVVPELAEHCQVLLYNRRGVGKSAKADIPQSGSVIIHELKCLLQKLDLKPPYILVGHSLGGLYANLFARSYPNEIAAVVFVDAAHPEEIIAQRQFNPPWLLFVFNTLLKRLEKCFDPFKYSEDECIDTTVEQVNSAGPFPAIPIAVVSGTKKMPFVPEASFLMHQDYQQALMQLSPISEYYLCSNSGHFPQVTDAEIVSQAVLETCIERW